MRLFVLVASCFLGLTSCGSTSFLSITPALVNGPAMDGRPTSISYHPDSVEVQVSFVRYEPTELVFEVEIGNDSRRPVLVTPETFFYAPVDTASTTTAAALQPRVAALNPELRMKLLAARLEKEAAKAEKVSWFEILTSVSHVAEDISSIKKKETDEQVAEREERHQTDNAYFNNQREQHAQEADALYAQHHSRKSVALRRTELKPGEYVRGQVYFPRTDAARRLRVVVFFDAQPVPFDFKQQAGPYYSNATATAIPTR